MNWSGEDMQRGGLIRMVVVASQATQTAQVTEKKKGVGARVEVVVGEPWEMRKEGEGRDDWSEERLLFSKLRERRGSGKKVRAKRPSCWESDQRKIIVWTEEEG
jgi:hypothetical protein